MELEAGTLVQKAKEAVENGARKFPPELKLQLATGECDVHNGYLRY